MKRKLILGIISTVASVVLISVTVYFFWVYSPAGAHWRSLSSTFWLSLDNDTRQAVIQRGQKETFPVELHHWKDLEKSLYLKIRNSDGSTNLDKYPGLSISFDLDSSVVSLSKGAIVDMPNNSAATGNPHPIKYVSNNG